MLDLLAAVELCEVLEASGMDSGWIRSTLEIILTTFVEVLHSCSSLFFQKPFVMA